ncbi:MAG: nucleotide-binding protein [Lentimicrobiaceae bacterium]|jgi:hypothetical protein|nr:nucleotide-binding protein [Lentimicrobiaceae bacterium]
MSEKIQQEKVKIFIGSATKDTDLVTKITELLLNQPNLKIIPWTEGFDLSKYTLDNLIDRCNECKYAIFVLGESEKTKKNGKIISIPRDNVIFEIGMFSKKNGKENTFLLVPDSPNFHLFTDYAGVTHEKYCRNSLDIDTVINNFCEKVLTRINQHESDLNKIMNGKWLLHYRNVLGDSNVGEEYFEISNCEYKITDVSKFQIKNIRNKNNTLEFFKQNSSKTLHNYLYKDNLHFKGIEIDTKRGSVYFVNYQKVVNDN